MNQPYELVISFIGRCKKMREGDNKTIYYLQVVQWYGQKFPFKKWTDMYFHYLSISFHKHLYFLLLMQVSRYLSIFASIRFWGHQRVFNCKLRRIWRRKQMTYILQSSHKENTEYWCNSGLYVALKPGKMSKQIVCIPAIVVFERKPRLVCRVIDLAESPNISR